MGWLETRFTLIHAERKEKWLTRADVLSLPAGAPHSSPAKQFSLSDGKPEIGSLAVMAVGLQHGSRLPLQSHTTYVFLSLTTDFVNEIKIAKYLCLSNAIHSIYKWGKGQGGIKYFTQPPAMFARGKAGSQYDWPQPQSSIGRYQSQLSWKKNNTISKSVHNF